MVQAYALLMIAFLSKISIRLDNENSEPPTKRNITYPLFLCAGVGILIGALFRHLSHTPSETASVIEIKTVVLLVISTFFFSFIPHITTSSQSDRGGGLEHLCWHIIFLRDGRQSFAEYVSAPLTEFAFLNAIQVYRTKAAQAGCSRFGTGFIQ